MGSRTPLLSQSVSSAGVFCPYLIREAVAACCCSAAFPCGAGTGDPVPQSSPSAPFPPQEAQGAGEPPLPPLAWAGSAAAQPSLGHVPALCPGSPSRCRSPWPAQLLFSVALPSRRATITGEHCRKHGERGKGRSHLSLCAALPNRPRKQHLTPCCLLAGFRGIKPP